MERAFSSQAFIAQYLKLVDNTENGISMLQEMSTRYTKYLLVFSPNAENAGKIRTRITPNTDTLYAVLQTKFEENKNYTS